MLSQVRPMLAAQGWKFLGLWGPTGGFPTSHRSGDELQGLSVPTGVGTPHMPLPGPAPA